MASKYAGLQHTIPQEPTERDAAIEALLEEHGNDAIAALITKYNLGKVKAAEQAAATKTHGQYMTAIDILIRRKLDAEDADAITVQGFNWSEIYEPYPQAEDPEAIVKYFLEHDMGDQLKLTKTELASRLKNHVKNEATNNELVVTEVEQIDKTTGETKMVKEVRSNIPGVKVFLKASLSRTKASTKRS